MNGADFLVIGGGVAGLSAALVLHVWHLAQRWNKNG